jgi:tetratricopeptide (TPR) repeat protein
MRLGQYDQAIQASQQAQKLSPAEANYVYNAAMIYLAKDDPRGAERTLRSALGSLPDSPRLHEGLGEVLYKLSLLQEADGEFRRALELDSTSGNAQVALAKLLYALGDREGFRAAATAAIRLAPDNYLACYYYGKFLEEQRGQLAEGGKYIEKSCTLSPGFTEGWIALGMILQRQERWAEAAAAYERAVAGDPKNPQAYYLLSIGYRKMGDIDRAEQALDQFRRLQAQ